ncbi:hypothetical protein HZ326_30121 [Fusarium oxysporum f. sp. albedinis]|nr:hypothetical protein HZ326_30121 [Fusarium oxysporum f. sp. albedinis]
MVLCTVVGYTWPAGLAFRRSLEEITFHFDEHASLHDEFVSVFEIEELAHCHSNGNAKIMENESRRYVIPRHTDRILVQ